MLDAYFDRSLDVRLQIQLITNTCYKLQLANVSTRQYIELFTDVLIPLSCLPEAVDPSFDSLAFVRHLQVF